MIIRFTFHLKDPFSSWRLVSLVSKWWHIQREDQREDVFCSSCDDTSSSVFQYHLNTSFSTTTTTTLLSHSFSTQLLKEDTLLPQKLRNKQTQQQRSDVSTPSSLSKFVLKVVLEVRLSSKMSSLIWEVDLRRDLLCCNYTLKRKINGDNFVM